MAQETNSTSRRPTTNAGTTTADAATATACCGGPAPHGANACCARDAEVKSAGGEGCGCESTPAVPAKKTGCCQAAPSPRQPRRGRTRSPVA
jgi:hypothetical protein